MLSFFIAAAALAIDPVVLSNDIKVLASDEFEGRGPGTAGEQKTVDYLIKRFREAGAEPAGENGGWTQELKMHKQTIAADRRLGVKGRSAECSFDLAADTVLWTQNPATKVLLAAVPMVFGGYGVNDEAKGWDDFAGADLSGKVVLLFPNDPDWSRDDGPFGGKRLTIHGRMTTKFEEAARRGAAAVLMIHDDASTQFDWATTRALYSAAVSGVSGTQSAKLRFTGYLRSTAARRLLACARVELDRERSAAEQPGYRAKPLAGVSFSADLDVDVKSATTRNVVARIRGGQYPDEHFVYTAHWDHLGRGKPDKTGDDIYNGALDNAGGTAGLLSLAEAFGRGQRPDRSILFIAMTLEESGLLGSEYYASHPTVPLAKMVGGFNMDAVNLIGATRTMEVTSMGQSTLEDHLQRELAAQGREMKDDPNSVVGFYYRSDHFPFARRGVPFVFAGSGWELAPTKVPNTRDPEVGTRYHQPMDQWYPELDFAAAARDIDLYYRVGLTLANSREWPVWKPGTEFAAERAKSDSKRR